MQSILCEFSRKPITKPSQLLLRQSLTPYLTDLSKSASKRSETGAQDIWSALEDALQHAVAQFCAKDDVISRDCLVILSKLVRNLVAGVSSNQEKAFAFVPVFRKALAFCSSLYKLEDEDYVEVTSTMIQAQSNIITLNPSLAAKFFAGLVELEPKERLICNLLATEDDTVQQSLFILILNLLQSPNESSLLATSSGGRKVLGHILEQTDFLFRNEESENFEVAYRIFVRLMEDGFLEAAFKGQSVEELTIVPSQLVLLKLLDANLSSKSPVTRADTVTFLVSTAKILIGNIQNTDAIQRDRKDTAVYEAFVIVLNCLTLVAEQHPEERVTLVSELAKPCIDLLQSIDELLPELQPITELPTEASQFEDAPEPSDISPSSVYKRTLVRFLGTCAFESTEAQDGLREVGAIEEFVKLSKLDTTQPYLREHALFALGNVIKNHQVNQAYVVKLGGSQ